MSKYYLTTPIFYVNAAPHIGHTYTMIAADVIRRYKRMQGYRAILTTGTDEHGQKIERAARAAGKAPEEFTTIIANEFRQQWDLLGLTPDRFRRTTDPRHHRLVQELFTRCKENGYVYKGAYTGQYCFQCELYVSEGTQPLECPDCGRPTETVTEENYFFRLSAFQQRLLEFYDQHPDFILPESRRNEVVSFVRQGLNDLSITRTNIKWGIPVPGEPDHVFYVWFDALTTYVSAVEGEDLWPADLHLIGKEILRFHAVYWPAFLMAAGWPLPKQIFAHGWLLFEQDKMSKSRGNIVRPLPIKQVVGMDGLRFFLLREIVFGQDGSFSYDALVNRYNSDLANGLGNLTSRTLKMIRQYRQGRVPAVADSDPEIEAAAKETIRTVLEAFDRFEFARGLDAIWALLSRVDKFLVREAPWQLAKSQTPEDSQKLDRVLYTAAEVLRIATVLVAPVIPEGANRIWQQLGMREPLEQVRVDRLTWGQLPPGQEVQEPTPVFPRLELQPAVQRMRELEIQESARQAALLGQKPAPETTPRISIDEFAKVELRVAKILAAERVAGADKLLKLVVDAGEPKARTLVAGIAEAYQPEELVGRSVVIVANLEPRKLRGIESNGMVLAATPDSGLPVLLTLDKPVPPGTRIR